MLRFVNEERTNILINSLNELLNNYRIRNNTTNISMLNDNSYVTELDTYLTDTYLTDRYITDTYITDTYSTDTYSTDTYSTDTYPIEDYNFFNNQRNNILYNELENSIINSLQFTQIKYKKVISDNGKKMLKKIKFNKNDDNYKNNTCPIIQTEFENNEIITELPCKHCFNTEAITHWLEKEKAQCPVCRFELDYDEIKIEEQEQEEQEQEQEQERRLTILPMNNTTNTYIETLAQDGMDNNLIETLINSRTNLIDSFSRTYSDPLTIINDEQQYVNPQE